MKKVLILVFVMLLVSGCGNKEENKVEVKSIVKSEAVEKIDNGAILIDVNGENPPNVIGIDMHGFRVGQPCSYKKETDPETRKEKIVGTNRTGSFGIYAMGDGINDTNGTWACTSYVIKHKAMPWLYKSSQNGCVDYYAK